MASPMWKCFLCWKLNPAETDRCECCRRERSYAPKSLVDSTHAQPLALHGLASALHPFREEQIQALAARGLDLGAVAANGWTALHCAARLGQDDVVRNLLVAQEPSERRVMVEAASVGGWRSLHHAIGSGGHLRVVEELLLADADVNARLAACHDGLTPLHLAASHGHTFIIDLLLRCEADSQATTERLGRTALHLAIAGGHLDTTRLLCARTDLVDKSDLQGTTPIQQAHFLRDSPTKRELIDVLETALRERYRGTAPRLLPEYLINHA